MRLPIYGFLFLLLLSIYVNPRKDFPGSRLSKSRPGSLSQSKAHHGRISQGRLHGSLSGVRRNSMKNQGSKGKYGDKVRKDLKEKSTSRRLTFSKQSSISKAYSPKKPTKRSSKVATRKLQVSSTISKPSSRISNSSRKPVKNSSVFSTSKPQNKLQSSTRSVKKKSNKHTPTLTSQQKQKKQVKSKISNSSYTSGKEKVLQKKSSKQVKNGKIRCRRGFGGNAGPGCYNGGGGGYQGQQHPQQGYQGQQQQKVYQGQQHQQQGFQGYQQQQGYQGYQQQQGYQGQQHHQQGYQYQGQQHPQLGYQGQHNPQQQQGFQGQYNPQQQQGYQGQYHPQQQQGFQGQYYPQQGFQGQQYPQLQQGFQGQYAHQQQQGFQGQQHQQQGFQGHPPQQQQGFQGQYAHQQQGQHHPQQGHQGHQQQQQHGQNPVIQPHEIVRTPGGLGPKRTAKFNDDHVVDDNLHNRIKAKLNQGALTKADVDKIKDLRASGWVQIGENSLMKESDARKMTKNAERNQIGTDSVNGKGTKKWETKNDVEFLQIKKNGDIALQTGKVQFDTWDDSGKVGHFGGVSNVNTHASASYNNLPDY